MSSPVNSPSVARPVRRVVVDAPAKLNLVLRVLGRRDDGYHELESVFAGVSWFDTLTLTLRTDRQIRLRVHGGGADVPSGPDNLVVRAAMELQKTSKTCFGVDIDLVKRIPSQAGLGGGSSDASGVLLGLTRLWGLRAEKSDLHTIAASLGSDLNFFLLESVFGIARGRGENVQPLDGLTDWAAVIVQPPFGAETAKVFQQSRFPAGISLGNTEYSNIVQSVLRSRAPGINHLQPGLCHSEPRFGAWLKELEQQTHGMEVTNGDGSLHKEIALDEDVAPYETDCGNQPPIESCLPDAMDNALTADQRGVPSDEHERSRWSVTGSGTAVYRLCRTPAEAQQFAARLRALAVGRETVTSSERLAVQHCQAVVPARVQVRVADTLRFA